MGFHLGFSKWCVQNAFNRLARSRQETVRKVWQLLISLELDAGTVCSNTVLECAWPQDIRISGNDLAAIAAIGFLLREPEQPPIQ
jgi:hypothetical protein